MLSMLNNLFTKKQSGTDAMLAELLARLPHREELLGMGKPLMPTQEGIRADAAKMVAYTETNAYKKWAEEAWGRVINGLDKILDERSSNEVRQYHCGAVRATLDLLRVSYMARHVVEEYDESHPASLRLKPQKQG